MAAILATGNRAVVEQGGFRSRVLENLPASVQPRLRWVPEGAPGEILAGALIEGDADTIRAALVRLAERPGPLILAQAAGGDPSYNLDWLLEEVSVSVNTAAAGGNASLMSIG